MKYILTLAIVVFVGVLIFSNSDLLTQTFSPEETFVAQIPLRVKDERVNKKEVVKKEINSKIELCSFDTSLEADHNLVLINEVAWMGNARSFSGEWIELVNISENPVTVPNWQILDKDEQIKIVLPNADIPAKSFYLLERGEEAVASLAADFLYVGNLRNSDEGVRLFDGECNLIDEVLAEPDWPAGDNRNKFTMERDLKDLSWYTSSVSGGTPKKENSVKSGDLTSPITVVKEEKETILSNYSPPPPEESTSAPVRILINEVMVGVEDDAKYEFVELVNIGQNPVDLTGWSLKKKSSTGNESLLVASSRLEGKIINPGGYLLLINSGGGAVGLLFDVEWPASYALAYTKNEILLYNSSGETVDSIFWDEIPRGSSLERASWDGNSFKIQSSPSPTGSN